VIPELRHATAADTPHPAPGTSQPCT
jgi:hypothetical protein